MRRDRFVESRRERWVELEALLRNRRPDLLRLGRLYRAVTSDLAVAHRDYPGDPVADYLNNLVVRAHPLVYRGRPATLRRMGEFLRYGFPAAYRRTGPYIAVAFGLFAVAAAVSGILVALRPSLADVLLPGDAENLRSVLQQHHLWVQSATSNHSVAANFIMLNNIKVAFLAVAGGVTLGLLTAVVLLFNGLSFGTIVALTAQYGLAPQLLSFVVPHGVIELSVIFMAGGAGLRLADSVLRPGLLPRGESLARAARETLVLVLGAVPLLIVAGTIEGFFSASNAPFPLKLAVGAGSGVLLYGYLLALPLRPSETAGLDLEIPVDHGGGEVLGGDIDHPDAARAEAS